MKYKSLLSSPVSFHLLSTSLLFSDIELTYFSRNHRALCYVYSFVYNVLSCDQQNMDELTKTSLAVKSLICQHQTEFGVPLCAHVAPCS